MPSAAGIIVAAGAMRIANHAIQLNQPLSTVADKIDWKVIPATAIAAGIFYGLESGFGNAAKLLALLAFFTSFITPDHQIGGNLATSPLGALLKITGQLPSNAG